MAKVFWWSVAPWVGTGYGTQTALFAPLLAERGGHDLAFGAFYGLHGSRLTWASKSGQHYPVYPGSRDGHANDVVKAHVQHWFQKDGGIFVMLSDPWVMRAPTIRQLPCVAWVPIDHDPIIPDTIRWFETSAAVPLAMSRFGERVMRDAGLDPLYCPHGYDPDVFHPGDKAEARKMLGLSQDAFIVSMVAANKGRPGRKSWGEALDGFAKFKRDEGADDAVLYIHTKMNDPDGVDIEAISDELGLDLEVTNQYALALGAPETLVALIHQAADVLLNPSTGEGFGVPMIEAQACGTPVITTNFSASPEVAPRLIGNWCVDGQRQWTQWDSWQIIPSVEEIAESLAECYGQTQTERELRTAGILAHAAEYVATDVTDKYMIPAIAAAEKRIRARDKKDAARKARHKKRR